MISSTCAIYWTTLHGSVMLTSPAGHSLTLNLCVLHSEADCQVVWEKKPTPEEEEKAKSLLLPPTFFCGLSTTDSDPDQDKSEDFETEVRKAQQDLVTDTTLRKAAEFLH